MSATWKKASTRDKNVEANSMNQIKITVRSITSRLHNAEEKVWRNKMDKTAFK